MAPQRPETLKEYLRTAPKLKTLQNAIQVRANLAEKNAELERRLLELQSESVALLDSDDDSLEKESALATRIGVLEAKLSRARERQGAAEGCLSNEVQRVRSSFGTLFRVYRLWQVEREKARLLLQMMEGCPQLSIDQVVSHLKTIATLSVLEITAESADGTL